MLTSILNVNDEFFKKFSPSVTVPEGVVIPVSYARKSAQDLSEADYEEYPQIKIYDYLPEFDPDWTTSYFKRVDGFRDTDADGKVDRAYIYQDPIRLLLKFDVTAYCKNPRHRMLIWNYFIANYQQRGQLTLNQSILNTPQYDLHTGDVVGYSVIPSEVTRTDGVYELNFEFTLKPMVAIVDPIDVVTLEQLTITLNTEPYTIIATIYQNGTYIPVVITQVKDTFVANIVSATSFIANHNFDKEVLVAVLDSNGIEVFPEVIHSTLNSVILNFSVPFTGKVIIK